MRGLHFTAFACATVALTACSTIKDVQCLDDTSCDLAIGGQCITTTNGNQWCAYPDASCPAGMRYSDFDVGDGLGGVCAPAQVRLMVEKAGHGSGSVTGTVSTAMVINCGPAAGCEASIAEGTLVTLTAMSAAGDIFYGWSGGGCTGTGECVTTVQAATTITATFDQCDRASADSCDDSGTIYERCDAGGQLTSSVTCPMYCSPTAKKCVDLDPSDDPVLHPLDALMDVLSGTGQNLVFPSSCTAASCSINTDNGTISGATFGAAAPSTVVTGSGRVFRVESLNLQGIVKVTGGPGLVILSNDAIVIRGVLDASADLRISGPGRSGSASCVGRFHRASGTVSAGGGGGGRNTAGGSGGNSAGGAAGAAGGMIESEPAIIPLQGGCEGGWVDEQGGSRVTFMGGGGGAVQLVSRKSVSILGGGVIDVSGGGGPSGDTTFTTEFLGGTGGGSGGSVLLEAPAVVLDGSGVALSAKGGGGSASGSIGFNGADGGYASGAAPGGMNPSGASGGAGATESTPPGVGQNALGTPNSDGGGGGGAVGLCRINTRNGDVTQQNGAALRCIRPSNTMLAERVLP